MFLYRKYIYIESISIFENLSMFENFSMLVLKAVKVREMPRHFPPWHECCCVVECFAAYIVVRGSTFYLKPYINKLPRLASVPLTEVVLQTLSTQSRDFEEIFLTSSRRRAPAFSATFLALVLLLFNPNGFCAVGLYVLEYYYKESDKDSIIYFVRFNSPELRMGV